MKSKFEDLKAWQEAHKLTLMIYKATEDFPKGEEFGLKSQIRRSSASVAANLVEGSSRSSRKEYKQFAYQARGSLEETKYHLLLARDLKYITFSQYEKIMEQVNTVGRLVNGLIKYLRTNTQDPRPNL